MKEWVAERERERLEAVYANAPSQVRESARECVGGGELEEEGMQFWQWGAIGAAHEARGLGSAVAGPTSCLSPARRCDILRTDHR